MMSTDGWEALYNAGTHPSYHECLECDALALLRYCTMRYGISMMVCDILPCLEYLHRVLGVILIRRHVGTSASPFGPFAAVNPRRPVRSHPSIRFLSSLEFDVMIQPLLFTVRCHSPVHHAAHFLFLVFSFLFLSLLL